MRSLIVTGLLGLLALVPAHAAIVTVDFEGVVADTGFTTGVNPYTEDGMRLTHSTYGAGGGSGIFGKDSSGPLGGQLYNDSAVYGWCNADQPYYCKGDEVNLTEESGNVFDLLSIDVGTLGTFVASGPVVLQGYLAGGGVISTSLTTVDGVMTTYALSGWTGLTSVRLTGNPSIGEYDIAIDNIVVNAVPIPAAVWLFGSALAGLGWLRRKPAMEAAV